jgi:hypothetical protein
MKKLILFLLVLGAMQLTAQKIEFEVKEINYGDLMQGDNGLRIFKFKNTGTAPLIISEVQKTCGCTSPDYTKTPIMPGEAGEIKVSYDTNRIGQFTKFVIVNSNDPENNAVQLKINGNVKPKENLPEAPANFIGK